MYPLAAAARALAMVGATSLPPAEGRGGAADVVAVAALEPVSDFDESPVVLDPFHQSLMRPKMDLDPPISGNFLSVNSLTFSGDAGVRNFARRSRKLIVF